VEARNHQIFNPRTTAESTPETTETAQTHG
jgi:hypothetical protein